MITLSISQSVCDIITDVCQGLSNFLSWILGLLPDDPLNLGELLSPPEQVTKVLAYVNWFVPLGTIISMIATWFVAIMLFQVLRFAFKAAHLL